LALVWALLMAVSSLILMDVGSEVREGLGRGRRGARALLSRLELARGHFFYFLFLSPSFFFTSPSLFFRSMFYSHSGRWRLMI